MRYLGTLGGNVANGDPGNDMPAVMHVPRTRPIRSPARAASAASRRGDFYQGAYFTALEPGEILTAIRIPVPPAGHGWAYEKLKRKIGDYATAAAAVVLTLSGRQRRRRCSIAPHQCRRDAAAAEDAARLLVGSTLDAATVKQAVAAAEAITAPASDTRGPPQYRTKMAGVMVAPRARRAARARAPEGAVTMAKIAGRR